MPHLERKAPWHAAGCGAQWNEALGSWRRPLRLGPALAFVVLIWVVGGAALARQGQPAASAASRRDSPLDPLWIQGMTISCQAWGGVWDSPGFALELDRLVSLGVNWVAIHPYARVDGDGGVRPLGGMGTGGEPPGWVRNPIEAAHARGVSILIKPHLAYWGSPFSWRGEIEFPEPGARQRFWSEYRAWILALASIAHDADGFSVGCELGRMLADPAPWRELIAEVRATTPAPLTYSANWDRFAEVEFWDALDAVGVQAYFPLSDVDSPSDAELRAGWRGVLDRLRAVHERTGKPVVFTELGYDASPFAAREPWRAGRSDFHGASAAAPRSAQERAAQSRLLALALEVLEPERAWLRGAFLWKWFVGRIRRGDHAFHLDHPGLRQVIGDAWR